MATLLKLDVFLVYICVIAVIVLAQGTAFSKAAEFLESPTNVTVIAGSEEGAVFRCHHSSADALVTWLINGSPPGAGIIIKAIDENGTSVSTLTVPATPDFNGSQITCVAAFLDGRSTEITPSATLTIIASPSTTTETITTTTESITTVKPTTDKPTIPIFSDDFIEVPSPPLVAVTMDEMYVYRCNHSETERIFWIINNTRLNEISPSPPLISPNTIPLPDGGRVSILTIGGLREHNGTVVQCLAISQDQLTKVMTVPVTFLIQGSLQEVKYLNRSQDTIEWRAPFSLDLTNVEPDIVYCVEVYNITCGRSLVISDCDVLETSYSSDDLRPGYIYDYTVTPRSNVEGAQNGMNRKIIEKFKKLQLSSRGHSFSTNGNKEVSADLQFISPDIQRHLVLASSYVLSLSPIDGVELGENESSLLVPATSRRNEDTVTLTTSLPFRRRFNYTVLAHGCEENPVTDAMEISTHDIRNVFITSPLPNIVRITGEFIRGSTSSTSIGVLAIIVPLDLDLSPTYRFIPPESTTSLGIDIRMSGGDYSISVFVIEESGLPFTRTASKPMTVTVSGGVEQNLTPKNYELESTSTGVCITCTFLESSTATDCVAVVHQRISQLNSTGLRNIDSHKFTRSGDTASGCIEGVNLEDYQVGVISVNTEVEITDPPTEEGGEVVPQRCDSSCVAVASVVAVSLCLCVVLLVAILALLYRRKLKSKKLRLHATMRSNSPESNVYTRVDIGQEVVKDQCEAQSTSAGAKDSGYADIMDFKSDSLKPLPQRDNVVYDDIQGFRNPSGQHYALLGLQGEPGDKPDDLSAVVYSEVKAPAAPTEPEQDPSETKQDLSSPTTTTTPFDLEHLLSELMGVASKWKDLGEALLLDDDLLDEIYTNNETDEACLQDMLEKYLMRIDGNHSWEDMHAALRKINQEEREAVHRSEDVESISSEPLVKGKEVDTLVKENDHVGSDNLFNHATESSHQSESHLIINTTQLEQAHDQRQDDQEPDLWQGNGHTDADVGDSHAPDSERTLHTSIMAAIN